MTYDQVWFFSTTPSLQFTYHTNPLFKSKNFDQHDQRIHRISTTQKILSVILIEPGKLTVAIQAVAHTNTIHSSHQPLLSSD